MKAPKDNCCREVKAKHRYARRGRSPTQAVRNLNRITHLALLVPWFPQITTLPLCGESFNLPPSIPLFTLTRGYIFVAPGKIN